MPSYGLSVSNSICYKRVSGYAYFINLGFESDERGGV